MFDGKVFRSRFEYNEKELEALPYYFEKLLKECHCKEDFCKHCMYYCSYPYKPHFTSLCNFCLDLQHMQFEPEKYQLYDTLFEMGKINYLIN